MKTAPSHPGAGSRNGHVTAVAIVVTAAATAMAFTGAHREPTSWNDSSRVATVESLVDRHTFAIDDSRFARDIGDKVLIDGRFYSHKPPVPAVLMAGVYKGLQTMTGINASDHPAALYRQLTIGSSGVSYVIAVWCAFQLGRRLGLPVLVCALLAASLAFGTIALPYSRAVNDHILSLAIAALVTLIVAGTADVARARDWSRWRLAACGTLAGLAYTVDVASGLPLLACVAALIVHRHRAVGPLAVYAPAALLWVALHHAINYAIGGSLRPVAMIPEYFQWPGSPFSDTTQLTGAWNHASAGAFVMYAVSLLVGKYGFLLFNLPLWLALLGCAVLVRRRPAEWPELLTLAAWAIATWLAYATLSTNYSGGAVSIRWFVPLLAAGFYVLGVLLRERADYRIDLVLLTCLGAIWMFAMWRRGPWSHPSPSINLRFLATALLAWSLWRIASRWVSTPTLLERLRLT